MAQQNSEMDAMSARNAEVAEDKPKTVRQGQSTFARPKQPHGKETILLVRAGTLQQEFNRARIHRALIAVPGIISLTYNLAKNHCIIRGKRHVASEVFGIAVANLGFEVSLVVKNESLEEVIIPVKADEKEISLNENMPEYLPEDYFGEPSISENAVCKTSNADTAKDGSILGSALSFVRKSFYW